MRALIFLLTLLVVAGSVALSYAGFSQIINFVEYMAASTGLTVVLSFLWGHYMYRTWRNRKNTKEAESLIKALEEEKRELAASRTALETKLLSLNPTERPMPPSDLDPEITQKIMMNPPPTANE